MTQPPDFNAQSPSQPPKQEQPQVQQKPPQVGYEFTGQQDDVIRSLSKKMKFVGVFYLIASGLIGLVGLVALFIAPLVGVFYLVLLTPELLIGIWTINAANSFRLVTDTSGHDIPHLMNALNSLRKLYTLMFWFLIIALGLMLLAIVTVILLWTMGLLPPPTGRSTFTMLSLTSLSTLNSV